MNKHMMVYVLMILLLGAQAEGRESGHTSDRWGVWWTDHAAVQTYLASDNVQSLKHIVLQWLSFKNQTYNTLFHSIEMHVELGPYAELEWWWLTPFQIHMYCDHEESLLLEIARMPLAGMGLEVITQQLTQNRERGIFLISQLDSVLRVFEPGEKFASYSDRATDLWMLREDCLQLCKKLAALKEYMIYHYRYFALYMVEDQCWKQYARELQTYKACSGDHMQFKVALQHLYLYELRVRPQWDSVAYSYDLNRAIAHLRATIAETPQCYVNRIHVAQELADVLTYFQEQIFELGW